MAAAASSSGELCVPCEAEDNKKILADCYVGVKPFERALLALL